MKSLRIIQNLALLVLLALGLVSCASRLPSEAGPEDFIIFRGDGSRASLEQLYRAVQAADITFLGENHSDPVAHYLEEKILRDTWEPNLALSLEMFETDVQLVMDEYLAGLIQEEHFIEDARAWDNYENAYRPLLEFARDKGIPVLAANAPRRYVNLVSRKGAEALQQLSLAARQFLPPLPYEKASPAYRVKFFELMNHAMPEDSHLPEAGPEDPAPDADPPHAVPQGVENASPSPRLARRLEAQSLWDATMAWSLAEYLQSHSRARLLHVNGSFHTEGRLGIVDHLAHYLPQADVLVITIQPSASFPAMDQERMTGLGDFVIVTNPDLPTPAPATQ